MTMIEKVAEAIFNKLCPGIRYLEADKEFYKEAAIAAIEAMREPSDAMMNIYYELNHRAGPRATFDVSTWERSIDAALKE